MFFNIFSRNIPATERFRFSHMGRILTVVIKRRSNAKRLTLRVRDGEVNLTTPPQINIKEAQSFITKHFDWVESQLQKDDAAIGHHQDGNEDIPMIWYQGELTKVRLIRNPSHRGRSKITYQDGEIIIHMPENSRMRPAALLEDWLKKQARVAIRSALDDVLPTLGEAPVPLSVRDQKTRWGSCSTTRRLSFNWRLIMAPPASLHYVVVHEAVHLIHHDHSSRFWNKVEDVMPDYRTHQHWLKKNQQALFANIERRLTALKPSAT